MENIRTFGLLMDPGLVKISLQNEGEILVPACEIPLLWIMT